MTIDDLAYEYNWEQWGDKYIREKARCSLVIDLHNKNFYIQAGNLEVVLINDIKSSQIQQIIKLFGAKL